MKRLLVSSALALCAWAVHAQTDYSPLVVNEVLASGTVLVNTNGKGYDRVEIYNNGSAPISLAGCSLTDSSGIPGKFRFGPDDVIAAHGFFVANLDDEALTNTFHIHVTGDSVYLLNPDGAVIDGVGFGQQITDVSLGRVPDGGPNWVLTHTSFGQSNVAVDMEPDVTVVKVNEVQAKSGKNTSDYVELFNTATRPVDISGLLLADKTHGGSPIAPRSFLGARGFATFTTAPKGETNVFAYGLDPADDAARLITSDGTTVLDEIQFGAFGVNTLTRGRLPDGSSNIETLEVATPGAPNITTISGLIINEMLTHTDPPLEDAIEFYNPTDTDIDMSGWFMSDGTDYNDNGIYLPTRFKFPAGFVVSNHSYRVLYEHEFRNNSYPTNFTFNSAHGGTVYIFRPDTNDTSVTNIVAFLKQDYGAAANGVSFGRWVTSDGDTDFTAMECRSFGMDHPRTVAQFRTGKGLPNDCGPKWGPVIFSEIMYFPPFNGVDDDVVHEFIELRNVTAAAVPLFDPRFPTNHYQIRGGVQFEFSKGDTIPRGGYLLVVSFDPATNAQQLAEFRSHYGISNNVPIRGPYLGKLSNNDDILELWRPDPVQSRFHPDAGYTPFILTDRVHYRATCDPVKDLACWPTDATGSGKSIQRLSTRAYGDDPTSWHSDYPTPGRVNAKLPTITQQPIGSSQLLSNAVAVYVTTQANANGQDSAPHYQWYFNRRPIVGATSDSYLIRSVTRASAGTYSVAITNFAGKLTSSNAVITLLMPVKIGLQPAPVTKTVPEGTARVVYRARATGSGRLGYQWFFTSTDNPIDGATNSMLVLTNVTPGMSGQYFVVATNNLGYPNSSAATSRSVTLTVTPRP